MVFDLRRFLAGEKPPADVQFSADFSGRDFADKQVTEPVQCAFTARLTSEGAALTLAVSARAEGPCARCLEPVREDHVFTCEYLVRPRDLEDPDFELPVDANSCLDVEELAYQELFMDLPGVLLCDPDCPGLCPVCGHKMDACTCEPTADAQPADARLSILKQFLK